MGYWKTKVLPKIKKVFEKNGTKKAAAAEACKSFDESKEAINAEFEEKKTELQPRVLEIYEASSTEIKSFAKEPKEEGVKKNAAAVHKFLEELVKIEFPGSKQVCEASSKFGPTFIPGPVIFIFEKVSSFVPIEEKVEETRAAAPEAEAEAVGETSEKVEKEIVIEEAAAKEEEIKTQVVEEEKAPVEPSKP